MKTTIRISGQDRCAGGADDTTRKKTKTRQPLWQVVAAGCPSARPGFTRWWATAAQSGGNKAHGRDGPAAHRHSIHQTASLAAFILKPWLGLSSLSSFDSSSSRKRDWNALKNVDAIAIESIAAQKKGRRALPCRLKSRWLVCARVPPQPPTKKELIIPENKIKLEKWEQDEELVAIMWITFYVFFFLNQQCFSWICKTGWCCCSRTLTSIALLKTAQNLCFIIIWKHHIAIIYEERLFFSWMVRTTDSGMNTP